MCTVTLRCGAGSLVLTMNRDERLERGPEEAPRRIPGEDARPSWIAPFDSASGGTWIGVNERGVASCILNGYEPQDEGLRGDPLVPSRGSIIPRILEAQAESGPARLPEALDFSAYPSFTLVVASPEGGEIVRWRRGVGLTREVFATGLRFLASSSWNEPEVAAWRHRAFDAWRVDGEREVDGMPVLHLLAPPGEEATAPFMTRDTAATRSITQVRVDGSRHTASLVWWPREGTSPIDSARPAASLSLDLAGFTTSSAVAAKNRIA